MAVSGKAAVALLLICALAVPVPAASSPVGIVTNASKARIGLAEAQPGSTLFAGDLVATDAKGRFVVRSENAQVYLLETSVARFAGVRQQLFAELERGTLGFAGEQQAQVEIRAAGAIFRSADGAPVHGQITILSPTELLVSAVSGNVEAEFTNKRVTVKEGTSHRMTLEAEPQSPAGAGSGGGRPQPQATERKDSRKQPGGAVVPQAPSGAAVGPTASLRATVLLALVLVGGAIGTGLYFSQRNTVPVSPAIP